MQFAQSRITYEQKLGSEVQPFRAYGYVGEQTRHVRYGWGNQGGIAIFSGDEAGEAAYTAATLADHWSRVDYCITVRDQAERLNPPEHYRESMRRYGTRPNGWPQMGRYEEIWGGDTWYIGKRISPYYHRCYNKTAESQGDYPPGCWRWECELKRHASEAAQARCRESGLTTTYIESFVAQEFQRYGLTVPWSPGSVVKRDPQVHHRADADRKIDWLERSISPTVEFLVEARGENRVLEALGLPSIRHVYHAPGKAAADRERIRSIEIADELVDDTG